MWNEIGFIASSKYREKIFIELNLNEITPKELSELTDIALPNVTRALKELEDIGMVECLNPDFKKGRLYTLTEMGKSTFCLLVAARMHDAGHYGLRNYKRIEVALHKNGIKYLRPHELAATLTFPITVDYLIPCKYKNIIIIAYFSKDPNISLIQSIGFECGDIKKNYMDIVIVLFLCGGMQFDERLMKLKEHGYVDEIFSEGEEERLVEFVKKYES